MMSGGGTDGGERRDVEEHEQKAAGFWVLCSLLVAIFLLAAPADAPILAPGGLAFVGGYLLLNLAYAARIALGPARTDAERLGVASVVTLVLGLQQYLAGGLPVLPVLAPLFVLGAVAVLHRRQRALYLPVVVVTALSPLLHLPLDHRTVIAQATLALALSLEMALLGEYGDRLRRQREQLADAERLASRRAVTDELTGLANRRALTERLATPDAGPATVVYCDLDGFKPFNDRFGHAAGDALLRRLGGALDAAAGGSGVAYRVGGDEFCVVAEGRRDEDGPFVAGLVAAMAEDGAGYRVRCSHGVARAPDDAVDLAGALRVADRRMYLLKELRRRDERGARPVVVL